MVDPIKKSTVFFQTNTKYSITLNPVDKHQYFGKPNRYRLFKNFMYEQLLQLDCEYQMFIEISEPTGFHTKGYSGPRLHLHGYILFPKKISLINFLLHHYYSLLRFTSLDIDTCGDEVTWFSYCTKQKLFKNNRLSNFSMQS